LAGCTCASRTLKARRTRARSSGFSRAFTAAVEHIRVS
jgi:hypothetical protein